MRGFVFAHHLPLVVIGLVLLALLPGSRFAGATPAHMRDNSSRVHISPHYYYAGSVQEQGFGCQKTDAPIHCYGPTQMRRAYEISPLLDEGITGVGYTIVIISAYDAPHLSTDLHTFDTTFSLSEPMLHVFYPDGKTPYNHASAEQVSWSGETALDVEWAHASAPGAAIALVMAKSSGDADVIHALRYAVDHNLGDVISMSFGESEDCVKAALVPAWHRVFYDAARKNITLLAAAGDNGAAEPTCDNRSYQQNVALPAVDPLVTAIGGTQLSADYQSGDYQSEEVWNEPAVQAAGGGGFSKRVRRPAYQDGITGIGQWRGVPDVAYNAAFDRGILVAWSDGPEKPDANGFYIYYGTSAGTPQWAGIVALVDQAAGKRVGFLNPTLYAIGRANADQPAFHDIASGNNAISLPDARNRLTKIAGYSATAGWDAATGWGTPRVSLLVPLLVNLAPAQGVTSGPLPEKLW